MTHPKFARHRKKYNAEKVTHSGYSFASKLESSLYGILLLMQKAGEIKEIQVQDTVYLTDARIMYKPDFKCTRHDDTVFWAESKGYETTDWRIKRRLWMHYGPGELQIWNGSHTNPKLHEVIKPKGNT